MKIKTLIILLLATATQTALAQAIEQTIEQTVAQRLNDYFNSYTTSEAEINRCKLDSITTDFKHRTLTIYANEAFGYQPFRPETVERIYGEIRQLLPGPVNYFTLSLRTGSYTIEELVPNYYRTKRKEQEKSRLYTGIKEKKTAPWVTCTSTPYRPTKGLANRHISLWQSHGRYYVNREGEWGWQRPRLFCTTEDLFTQSFVLPYLIPMLEQAGAVVYTPRERDLQRHEVIVDNDTPGTSSRYLEVSSRKAKWQTTSESGFAYRRTIYQDNENPFTEGSARMITTERRPERAFAEWIPDIPETGEYAVYVSYQTLPQSVTDAKYSVFHSGGVTEFRVNQQMGGGTWVYLGTFRFDQGRNDYGMVTLSNESAEQGVVTADAVRFGGGMGNVARDGKCSGLPRYLEGARYGALWNGTPQEVYNGYQSNNDYSDDINSRSRTLNYLNGGSPFNPRTEGLGIPFELNLALHSDAGYHEDDQRVGTLGIYTTRFNEGLLSGGTSRLASRDLADLLMSQLKSDLQTAMGSGWNRRSLWDRNYSETRLPSVASCIIELLSHQNFADMVWGHDPVFKFTVGRSLYKGILRFLATQHHTDYVVQPLPVTHFAIHFGKKKNTFELNWRPQADPTESTATADEYIVYTRIGRGGFDNGVRVSGTSYTVKVEPGVVYSFKVTAVNRGGESFPSEILSAYKSKQKERHRILIINGFDRLSGPAVVNTPELAGFNLEQDPGVPYLKDISLCGYQQVFDRKLAGKQLGESDGSLEGVQMAGNTFDYPFIHGKAIQASRGYSFVSCSDEAVEENLVPLYAYDVVDYILGLEKQDQQTTPSLHRYYKTFSSPMQRALSSYLTIGGHLLVSGAYVGSDMQQSESNRRFLSEVLKCNYAGTATTADRYFRVNGMNQEGLLQRLPNERCYALPKSDRLMPTPESFAAMTYQDGTTAAVAYRGAEYRTYVMGFPLECVSDEKVRQQWMASILQFLTTKSK